MDDNNISYLRSKDSMGAPYATIPEMILHHSKSDPESVAQVYINWETFEKENLTYTDIYVQSDRFARGLNYLGIQKGDIVALETDNTPECMTALNGILMTGAIPLMFVFNLKDGSDVVALIDKVGDRCKAVAFTEGQNGANIAIVNNILNFSSERGRIELSSLLSLKLSILISNRICDNHLSIDGVSNMGSPGALLPKIDPDDTAIIFMTSGSMGTPKLIPHTHFSILITGFHFAHVYGRTSRELFNDRPFSWMVGYVNIYLR